MISNLENNFESAYEVHSLFSTFGNIKKILFMKNLNKTLVEYFSIDSSLLCALNINNLKLKNTELRVNYSKYQTIDLTKNNQNHNAIKFNEVLIPSRKDFRYQKNDVVANLSSNLVVSLLGTPDKDFEGFIKQRFNGCELKQIDKRHWNISSESTEDSVLQIAKNHGIKYKGNFLNISFVK